MTEEMKSGEETDHDLTGNGMDCEIPLQSDEPPRVTWNSVGIGVCTGIAILASHALLLPTDGMIIVFFAGATQWLVVLPLIVIWLAQGRRESLKGLLIIAGLASLANAACCGLILLQY